jgi:D-alanyl-D-alanine carboxypeptidase
MRRGLVPGAIVAIQRAGRKPWVVGQGVANLLSRSPMRPDEHFRIGSVTKSFVTTVLMQLVQQRRLSLDDSISRFVPGVPNGGQITLRMLANMTTGLQNLFSNPGFVGPYLLGETFTPEQLTQFGLELPPLFAPGEKWSYSNTNTDLLGLVIQKVTGRSLAAVLRDRVFSPLGMRHTSLPSSPALPRPYPNGYTHQTVTRRLGDATFYTPSALWAAGGMVSDVPDMLRAVRMFGTGRPLLSSASQRQREQWVRLPPNSRIQRYGIGLFDFNGWIGHNGGVPGYTTVAWYLPSQRLSLVVFVNSDIHLGRSRRGYLFDPAPGIAHAVTEIISPSNVAPSGIKLGGSPATPLN